MASMNACTLTGADIYVHAECMACVIVRRPVSRVLVSVVIGVYFVISSFMQTTCYVEYGVCIYTYDMTKSQLVGWSASARMRTRGTYTNLHMQCCSNNYVSP